MADLGKDSREFQFFQDFWKFFKDNYYTENTDSAWEKVFAQGKELSKKYSDLDEKNPDCPFATKVILCTMHYIQEINDRA